MTEGTEIPPTMKSCPCLIPDSLEQVFVRMSAKVMSSPQTLRNGGYVQIPRLHLRSLDQLSKSSSQSVLGALRERSCLLSAAVKSPANSGSNRNQLALGFKNPVSMEMNP